MGSELISSKLMEFGIPDKYVSAKEIPDYSIATVAPFITGKKNLLVIGEHYYKKCVRIMRMAFIYNRSAEMKWVSQSQITYEMLSNLSKNPIDLLALVQLYEEPSENKKNLTGTLVNEVLGHGGKVVIGCNSTKILEASFPYDLDMIEMRFDIWKEKKTATKGN